MTSVKSQKHSHILAQNTASYPMAQERHKDILSHRYRKLVTQRHKVTVTLIHGCRFQGQSQTLALSHNSCCHPQVCGTDLDINNTDSVTGTPIFIGKSSYKHGHSPAARPAVTWHRDNR